MEADCIVRVKRGKSFSYTRRGRAVTDDATLERIRKLGIPPAYTDVRISPSSKAKVQCTALDAKGRTQRKYHADFTRAQSDEKFDRLADFADALPRMRRDALAMAEPLTAKGQAKLADLDALVGTAALLMDQHGIRNGSEKYLDENGSHGLTTLEPQHVKKARNGSGLVIDFMGKSGKRNVLHVTHPDLVRALTALKSMNSRNDRLFELSDGTRLQARDINNWLKEYGDDFVAKDFRTWRANVTFLDHIAHSDVPFNKTEAKRFHADAVRASTEVLGNTPAVFKKNYLDGGISASYTEDPESFLRGLKSLRGGSSSRILTSTENKLVAMLKRR